MDVNRLDLPPPGVAGSFDLSSYLREDVRAAFLEPDVLIEPAEQEVVQRSAQRTAQPSGQAAGEIDSAAVQQPAVQQPSVQPAAQPAAQLETDLGTAGHAAPSPYDIALELGTAGKAAPSHDRNACMLGTAGDAAPSQHGNALELGTAGKAAPSHNRHAFGLGTAGDAAPSQYDSVAELGTAGNAAPSQNRNGSRIAASDGSKQSRAPAATPVGRACSRLTTEELPRGHRRRAGRAQPPQRQLERCSAWRRNAGGLSRRAARRSPAWESKRRAGAMGDGAPPREPRRSHSVSVTAPRTEGVRRAPGSVSAQEVHGAVAGGAGQRSRQARPAPAAPKKEQRTRVPYTFAGLACGLVRRIAQCAGAFASYLRSAERLEQSAQRGVLESTPQKRGESVLFPLPLPST